MNKIIFLICLNILCINISMAQCLLQKDFNSVINIKNDRIFFNIEKKDGKYFPLLIQKDSIPFEISGFYLVEQKVEEKPLFKMNVDELFRKNINSLSQKELFTKVSQQYKEPIIQKAKWKNYKILKKSLDLKNLVLESDNIEKGFIKFYVVLVHNNKNDCSFFESDSYLYDFEKGAIVK